MNGLLQDLRYAVRQLRKSPGFTVVAVITLGLGIGANTAIFSLINAIMLRTLPVKDPQSLVLLKWTARAIPKTKGSSSYDNCPQGSGPAFAGGMVLSDAPLDAQGCSFSLPFFQEIQAQSKVFSDVTGFAPAPPLLVNPGGHSSRAQILFVSGNFFSALGAAPSMGRALGLSDDTAGAPPAVVVSYAFWQRELGGDSSVVGRNILVGKTLFTVCGVTGPHFPQLDPGVPYDLWLPLAFRPQVDQHAPKSAAGNELWLELLGRLQPDVTAAQAASAMSAAFAASTTNRPEAIFKAADAPQIELSAGSFGLATLRRNFSRSLYALFAGVVIVLLIACVNIAGLMLARSAARQREMAMRTALGASRGRIIRQLLTESLLLSLAGSIPGILLGYRGASALTSFLAHNWVLPLQLDARPDARVFIFTVLVSVLAGVGFGLAPALSAGRPDLTRALAGSGATGGHNSLLGNGLVLAQVGLAMVVLAGAGLVVRTLANLESQEVGFDAQNLIVFQVDATYGSRGNRSASYGDLENQLAALPGVTSVSRSGVLLLSGEGIAGPIFSEASQAQAQVHVVPMSDDFLKTMRIPLLAGRTLKAQDSRATLGSPIPAVVNEALAHRVFGNQNPLGQRFRAGAANGPEHEIVGVVGDAKYNGVREQIWPTVYTPLGDWGEVFYFEVRTAMNPNAAMPAIRTAVSHFDSNLLISGMKTQTEQIDQNLYLERLIGNLSGLFALLALIVACIGIYGLLSYQTARRTQEIGIRLALGGQRGDVLWLVLRSGTLLAFAGTLVGASAALALTRYLQSFLFGVKATDPLTLATVAFLLIAVALLASYLPARRAANVDPMLALRYE